MDLKNVRVVRKEMGVCVTYVTLVGEKRLRKYM